MLWGEAICKCCIPRALIARSASSESITTAAPSLPPMLSTHLAPTSDIGSAHIRSVPRTALASGLVYGLLGCARASIRVRPSCLCVAGRPSLGHYGTLSVTCAQGLIPFYGPEALGTLRYALQLPHPAPGPSSTSSRHGPIHTTDQAPQVEARTSLTSGAGSQRSHSSVWALWSPSARQRSSAARLGLRDL
ncbi:hypothetical protein NDU88_000368 [Pleurodeles waltl]|uniref:Uncharacterized protein n=1 Tax=Pleurodeles waltl TaxID=8319 RepID=A0AAV7L9L1_PLEWA|nr:hypothetical protein NDU88_000368 [Pleurodeles waltl]